MKILSPKIIPLDSLLKRNLLFYYNSKILLKIITINISIDIYDMFEYLPPKRELNRSFLEMSDIDPFSMGVMKLDSLG